MLDELLRKAARVEDVEVEHEFPRVGRRTLIVNARRLHRESGHESILLAFEDRTAARNTEIEREALLALEQQARQRAEEADRIKDEFMATLSHELRGPLSAMVGWVQVLGAGGLDEATRERGRAAIERSAKAQTRLIEDLLDYSRVVAGKLTLSPQLTDLVPVAGAAIEAVRSAAEAKGIRLELSTDAEAALVHGDPDRLQQVLWNVLSNAVKFTPRGGRVEVWIGRVGDSLHIRVSDTGQGISRDFLPHVFERFRQQDGTSRRLQGGLGLGLAIVKELVELHGGTVHADSPGEGQGATVHRGASPPHLRRRAQGRADPAAPEASRPESGLDGERPGGARGRAAAGRGGRRRQPGDAGAGLRAERRRGDRGGVGRGGDGGHATSDPGPARLRHRPAGRGWPGAHPQGQGPRSGEGGPDPGAGAHRLRGPGAS